MRLHFLEHESMVFEHTNITLWAEKRKHTARTTYVHQNEPLPGPDAFDWLVIMGGAMQAWQETEYPWLAAEKAYIKDIINADKPILGICFGAQLLAQALGADVFPNGCDEIGWRDVSLTQEGKMSSLFQNIPEEFTSFHWHSAHFSLPSECTRLAQSPPTANQAFICNHRPLIGLQFHPEFTIEIVNTYHRDHGREWQKSAHCEGREAIKRQTDRMPDTYWLMESLMDNMTG